MEWVVYCEDDNRAVIPDTPCPAANSLTRGYLDPSVDWDMMKYTLTKYLLTTTPMKDGGYG
jgi:hypothetical protein